MRMESGVGSKETIASTDRAEGGKCDVAHLNHRFGLLIS
jgi:hypothetical protein